VATASCIGAEFIKSLIDPGKFPQRLPIVERDREEKPRKNIFMSDRRRAKDLLKSGRNVVKKTENVTVKVTKSVAA
jgi:hypothetical protein